MTVGQCLCGAVSFAAETVSDEVEACHCNECQRWTGGGPLYSVRADGVVVTGGENIRRYNHSAWGERATCAVCGSTLFWNIQGRKISFLALGVIDDRKSKKVKTEIFIDHRPDWLPPHPGALQRTEAEMVADLNAYLAKKDQA